MCMSHLHMTLWDFYSYTPIEVSYALEAYFKEKRDSEKAQWERVRMAAYYNYLFTPSGKRKVPYNVFKQDYFQLNFDKEDLENREVISDEQFAEIHKIFKNKIEGTVK